MASINRYLGVVDDSVGTPEVAGLVGDKLGITDSKSMGTAYLLDGCGIGRPWHE